MEITCQRKYQTGNGLSAKFSLHKLSLRIETDGSKKVHLLERGDNQKKGIGQKNIFENSN